MTSKWRDAIPRETGAKLTANEKNAYRGNWNARLESPETKPPQYLPTSTKKKPTMLEIAKNMKPANMDHLKKMDDRTEYLTKQAVRDHVSDDAIKPKYANTEMMSASMPDFDQMLRDQQTVVRGQGRSMNMDKINKSVEPMNFAMLDEPVEIPKKEKKDERPEMMSAAMDLKPIDDFREQQQQKVKDGGKMKMDIKEIKPSMKKGVYDMEGPSPLVLPKNEPIPMMADPGDLYSALAREKQKEMDQIVQQQKAENERLKRELKEARTRVSDRNMFRDTSSKQTQSATTNQPRVAAKQSTEPAITRGQQINNEQQQEEETTNVESNDEEVVEEEEADDLPAIRSNNDGPQDQSNQAINTNDVTKRKQSSGNRFFSTPKLPNLFGSSKPKQVANTDDAKQESKLIPAEPIKLKPAKIRGDGPKGDTVRKVLGGAYNGAKRLYQGTRKAEDKVENKMKSLGTDLYGDEDTDTPAIRASLCLFNCIFIVMMFAFILTSFFLFGSYPVLVPDTFNTVALSASLLWLRLWWLKGSIITLMVMGAAVWSFAVNMFTFQLMHPVSYTMVTSDTLVLTPTLNRTVLNSTHVVDVSPSWWDAATWLHVVAMINETVTVMFLFLMSICQLNQARVSAARRRRQRRLGVAGEVVEQEVICIKVVGKCTRCEYCTCSNWICCRTRSKVTDSQWSDSLVTMMRVVAGLLWGLVLSSLALSMASALEHIPAWTTLESPHFFLVIGLVCWCTPPIGETYWYAPRQSQPTVVWAPRFVVGGVFLAFGLALSTWTLVMERQRVEWTTGAVWLNRDSYTAKLDGAGTTELYGGYTYSTTTALDKIKLRDYALGHHVIELLLVILTWVLLVVGTLVFVLDSSAILPDPSITGGLIDDDVEQQQPEQCDCDSDDCDSEVRVKVSVTA
jgi:hypothetical protein